MSPVDNLCSGGFHLIIFKILSQYSCYSTMLNLGYIWRLITTGVGMKLDGPGADKKRNARRVFNLMNSLISSFATLFLFSVSLPTQYIHMRLHPIGSAI